MTTLTNFLHGNFISSSQDEKQRPIWILSGDNEHKIEGIHQYLPQQVIRKKLNLIHLDLGIHLLKRYNEGNCESVTLENGTVLLKVNSERGYYVMKWRSKDRREENPLGRAIKQLDFILESEVMKKQHAINQTPQSLCRSYGLIIEGLELMATLPEVKLEPFINALSTLSSSYKQIVVYVKSNTLHPSLLYALERISTCLTHITSYEDSAWVCKSTVRRFTGYSNEEIYRISEKKGILKVEKEKLIQEEKETYEQRQMVQSLGFTVKKDQEQKKKQEEMKKIIYPHLRVQDECQCTKKCSGCENDDGLIILDDEQQDEDDVDV